MAVEIVMSDKGVDLLHRLAHAERAAPDRLLGNEGEPALDLIEPARVGSGATPFRWTVLGLRLDCLFAESFRSCSVKDSRGRNGGDEDCTNPR